MDPIVTPIILAVLSVFLGIGSLTHGHKAKSSDKSWAPIFKPEKTPLAQIGKQPWH